MKNNIELPVSVLTKSQKQKFTKIYTEGGTTFRITAEVRHDDECGNGHNTFSITGHIDEKLGNGQWRDYMGGCIHDEISKHFPNLAPFIKWHLTSTDAPMHYVANTVYLAGDRDYNGRRKGERYHVKGQEEKRVVFGDFPISFEFGSYFVKFIESVSDWQSAKVVAVQHENKAGETYKFPPKHTIKGFDCEWYQCPFDRAEEAQDFIKACQMFRPNVVIFREKFTRVGEGKERQLDAARSAAVWPEATDEELSQEPEQLKAALLARQSKLMEDFKQAVESLGFIY